MKLIFSKGFLKKLNKRIAAYPKLRAKAKEKIDLFQQNPNNPQLHNHSLKGARKELHSFSVTGDLRIIYKVEGNTVVLLDIGTHNQVY